MNNIIIKSPKSEKEYEEYYHLRWLMLRKPWNMAKGTEKDEGDIDAIHLMAMVNNNVAGVARLHFNKLHQAQIRYMAVEDSFQKKGVGSHLVNYIESIAKQNGADELILHARDIALDFYKKNKYIVVEKSYLLFDSIQHYLMKKDLRK